MAEGRTPVGPGALPAREPARPVHHVAPQRKKGGSRRLRPRRSGRNVVLVERPRRSREPSPVLRDPAPYTPHERRDKCTPNRGRVYVHRDDGTRIFWTSMGTGAAVVLSHGRFGDHRLFDVLATKIAAEGFRVVRWDLRAHGRSSRGPARPRFVDLLGDLEAVIAAAEVEDPVLVGHDIGGHLSLALAAKQAIQLQGLSLWAVDPAPARATDRVAAALVAAARQVSMRPILLALDPLWVRRAAVDHDAGLFLLHRRSAATLSANALADVVDAIAGRPDLRGGLHDLDLPVLVLWGQTDRILRPTAERELLAALSKGEGEPVPDAGHLFWIDHPTAVERRLVDWLRRVTSRASG